jgi:DNA gyrase inhibitor GyrI
MLYLLALPLLIIVGVLIFLLLQPGEINVRRMLTMRCTPAMAFERVQDLRGWRDWSPWLLHEPDAALSYSDDPTAVHGWYAWNGKLIGAGRITHVSLHPPERIEQRIDFKRPFKLTGAVSWELVPTVDEGAPATEVYWTMRGRMPFLLRFLAPMLSQLIGRDFELGLVRLRALLDPDAPTLDIRFPGNTELPAQTALTIAFDGGTKDMPQAMREGFGCIRAALEERGVEPAGPAFSAYHTPDAKAGRLRCDIAVPVQPGTAGGDFTVKGFPGGPCQATEVAGSYDFLELAWHALMAHLRMTKQQWDRTRPALEVYATGPESVASDNELVTHIYVPIRAKR